MNGNEGSRFVIFAAPRTGSNMLCTLLNSHPEILCHHEIFNPSGIFYALPLRRERFDLGSMERRDKDPVAFLNRVWEERLNHPIVGFKMTHRQNEKIFYAVLADRGASKIVLRRKNRIKTYVSRLVAEKSGCWEAYQDREIPKKQPRVTVNIKDLLNSIAFNEEYYAEIERELRGSNQRCLCVWYESLLSAAEQSRLLRFLGASSDHENFTCLKAESVKQNSSRLSEIVNNYEEIEVSLRGTEFESELASLSA